MNRKILLIITLEILIVGAIALASIFLLNLLNTNKSGSDSSLNSAEIISTPINIDNKVVSAATIFYVLKGKVKNIYLLKPNIYSVVFEGSTQEIPVKNDLFVSRLSQPIGRVNISEVKIEDEIVLYTGYNLKTKKWTVNSQVVNTNATNSANILPRNR
ncbi:MAG TPA: hypothetical protein PKA38_05275 [Candidatus Levybacteria bacterium]|nr:hypothetical protein [Candidatus Levybacteria bacterium]